MMRATADPKATSTTLLGISCVLLVGAVAGGFLLPALYPPPSAVAIRKTAERTARIERAKAVGAAREEQTARQAVAERTFAGPPADITPQVVNLTATLAKQRKVNWVRLQPPSKAALGGPLEEYTYLLVVEGPFPAVAALERDLEAPANRLAVNSFQTTSSDTQSNKVSASIGLVAHRVPDEPVVEKAKKK